MTKQRNNLTAARQSQGDTVFEDDFQDGDLAWTDIDHPEFWTEEQGQVRYSPSSSGGSIGDNALYADATVDGDQGTLEWPLEIEFKAGASDRSAGVGALAVSGGPKDWGETTSNVVLGITDHPHNDQFTVWNSEGEAFRLSPPRENNTWYTYRLVPDLENNVIQVQRNDESWTVPEPRTDPLDNISIVLSGGTCWGCGGTGDRQYDSIRVTNLLSERGASSAAPPEIVKTQAIKRDIVTDIEDTPPNVWLIGDTIEFRTTIQAQGGEPFNGDLEQSIIFHDLPDEGGVDVGWRFDREEQILELKRHQFTETGLELDPGETHVITTEVPIEDAFSRGINGLQPSMAFTDKVTVSVSGPSASRGSSVDDECNSTPCLKPADNVIRLGFLDLAAVLLALGGALLVKIKGGLPTEAVRPGVDDVIFLNVNVASSFNKAHQSYRAGDFTAVEEHFQHAFEEGGYSAGQAGRIVTPLVSGLYALDQGNESKAAVDALKALNEARVQNVELSNLPARMLKVIELLVGDIINIGDAIPTVMRAIFELNEPTDVYEQGHRVSHEFEPRTIIGMVTDQDGSIVDDATVEIFRRNPREAGNANPYAVTTTNSNGRFETAEAGPRTREILWFDIRDGDQLLTAQPRTREYRPDSGIPGSYGFQFNVNRATGEDRPEVDVAITDVERLADGRVAFAVELTVQSGPLDVTSWNSAGGVHVRLSDGTFDEVLVGDFAAAFGGNQLRERVDNLDEASLVELTTNQRQEQGRRLRSGRMVASPERGTEEFNVSFRAWGFDTDVPLKIDGQTQPYIARSPAGAEFNRHETDPGFTFLNYPTRKRTVRLKSSA